MYAFFYIFAKLKHKSRYKISLIKRTDKRIKMKSESLSAISNIKCRYTYSLHTVYHDGDVMSVMYQNVPGGIRHLSRLLYHITTTIYCIDK